MKSKLLNSRYLKIHYFYKLYFAIFRNSLKKNVFSICRLMFSWIFNRHWSVRIWSGSQSVEFGHVLHCVEFVRGSGYVLADHCSVSARRTVPDARISESRDSIILQRMPISSKTFEKLFLKSYPIILLVTTSYSFWFQKWSREKAFSSSCYFRLLFSLSSKISLNFTSSAI